MPFLSLKSKIKVQTILEKDIKAKKNNTITIKHV